MLKILGSLCVIFSGTSIGFLLAKRYEQRVKTLQQFYSCITALKSYMNYTASPLNQGIRQCANGVEDKVQRFFLEIAELLEKDFMMTPQYAMLIKLNQFRDCLALADEDCETMCLFATYLGKFERKEQEQYVNMIEERIKILIANARKERDKNVQLSFYFGICMSLMIVLLFV